MISLVPLEQGYMEIVRSWRNDPAIYKWCRQREPVSSVQQDRWFSAQAADPTIQMYMVKVDGTLSGVAGLTSIDLVNRRAEFSLYIAPDSHRMGYGKAALTVLLNKAFNTLGLHSVWGESFSGNPALGLFETLGFRIEGLRRDHYFRDGKFIDATLVSIKAEEWKK